MTIDLIHAHWNVAPIIKAGMTMRTGGFSHLPYYSFNLGDHVGDNPDAVAKNRALLCQSLNLPSSPIWLNQIHSNRCIVANHDTDLNADAIITRDRNCVLAIMTADCLPILLTNKSATIIGAVHAGWKGLAAGILENTLLKMQCHPDELVAWVGPAIGPCHFEVGMDVFTVFVNKDSQNKTFFTPHSTQGKFYANLPGLAQKILHGFGVKEVYCSNICTYQHSESLFSYRRDGVTGRMASLIWFDDNP